MKTVASIHGKEDRRLMRMIIIEHVPPPEPKLLEVLPNRLPPVLPPPKGEDVEADPKPR